MAVNKPTGDNARKGAVKKRSQLKGVLRGPCGIIRGSRKSISLRSLARLLSRAGTTIWEPSDARPYRLIRCE